MMCTSQYYVAIVLIIYFQHGYNSSLMEIINAKSVLLVA